MEVDEGQETNQDKNDQNEEFHHVPQQHYQHTEQSPITVQDSQNHRIFKGSYGVGDWTQSSSKSDGVPRDEVTNTEDETFG